MGAMLLPPLKASDMLWLGLRFFQQLCRQPDLPDFAVTPQVRRPQ
ncbi:hypothetical protein [Mumia zhuanghuii]|nr:hypothetical protein [Mumia zhuanghuii]